MEPFSYIDDQLYAEGVSVASLAEAVGTPFYVYSRGTIEAQWRAYDEAFAGRDHLVCYAVKANSNLAVLNILAKLGSGFDIVSEGELERVLRAGGDASRVVYSGVGKTAREIKRALEAGIACFNVESEEELDRINGIAGECGRVAPVSLRVNPDVDPNTHPYISTGLKESKFGIPMGQAAGLYEHATTLPHVNAVGVACHIGSQLTEIDPYLEALDRVLELVGELMDGGIELQSLDLGGGLGVSYYDEDPPEPDDLVMALMERMQDMGSRYQQLRFIVEPGRSIIGNAGLLITQVQYVKHTEARNFMVVDAAMNDLLRPAVYDAWHEIVPVVQTDVSDGNIYDVVGPVCESGDFLGRQRELSAVSGDLLAVLSVGAYGASMSSNYNTRPRVPEIMVSGDHYHVVRRREKIDDLVALESLCPD
ncbi:MAG: diaminopimelate decarboxylase [Gammaproteobacteria bacterium]|nr:MAG: diaminopimelate decarboxylase [Gammaproteobacteria bacterium]